MILIVSLFTALSTFKLSHYPRVGVIRASSLVTLAFFLLLKFVQSYTSFDLDFYLALVFGATFVGMSSSDRVGLLGVALGSIVYSVIFFYLVPLLEGFGGALGLSAFLGCVVAMCLRRYIIRK